MSGTDISYDTVGLFTATGDPVGSARVEHTVIAPSVVIWGTRCFVLDAISGQYRDTVPASAQAIIVMPMLPLFRNEDGF